MITLRPYLPDDWLVLVQHQYPGMTEAEAKKRIIEFNSGICNCRKFQMLAVDNGGQLVGYVSLFEQADGTASEGIAIYPPYRRQGFAFAAISQLLAMPHGYHTITAQIRKDNFASLCLHEKLGFRVDNEFVNRRGHPVYSLSLTLHQEIATSLRSSQ